ncbi:MAG: lysophospholipid acyltransferase family protein [Parvularculaceae bacterium]
MAPVLKQFLKSDFAGRVGSALVAFYIRFVFATSKWSYVGRGPVDALVASGQGFIVAFWHQRLLMGAVIRRHTDRRVIMLISANRDGEIVARGVAPFGIEFIRGSAANPRKKDKDKGGASALVQMIAALDEGAIVGMTPDGPRGPSRRAQAGVVRLAQMSGAPIIIGAFSASLGLRLNTWDRFFLAAPFSRGVFVGGGEPIRVQSDASPEAIEAARLQVETALNKAADEADILVGRSPDGARSG